MESFRTDPDEERSMSQKLENLLNLALETPEAVRLQTDNLNVGFDSGNRSWELIVKYHGSLDGLQTLGVSVEYLINSYAILTVPEQLVEAVSNIEEFYPAFFRRTKSAEPLKSVEVLLT